LVSFARSFGLAAEQTPGNYRLEGDKRTPDASVVMDDQILLIDVTGIDVLAPTYLLRNASGSDNAAIDRDKAKKKKYNSLEESFQDVQVVSFMYDLLGGLHPSAVDILKEIAKAGDVDEATYRSRIRMHQVHRCIARMPVSIQRDNAAMLRHAFLRAQS
jgi:hypothetical protein